LIDNIDENKYLFFDCQNVTLKTVVLLHLFNKFSYDIFLNQICITSYRDGDKIVANSRIYVI
jgi:hypothetical protein